jgi:membrane protein
MLPERPWVRPSVDVGDGDASAKRGYLADLLVLTVRMQPIDRALALASKLFVAIIPLSILVSGLVQSTDSFGEAFVGEFGLTGASARATETLFATGRGVQGVAGALGVIIVLYSMLGYPRGLQWLYLDAWELAPLGVKAWWRRATWTAGYTLYLAVATRLHTLERHAGPSGAYVIALLALDFAIALWGPWTLVGSRIPWRRLLPTAALTATGDAAFKSLSVVFAPVVFTEASQRYGVIGIAFSIVTWLFLDALVIVLAAIVTVAHDRRRHGPPVTGVGRPQLCAASRARLFGWESRTSAVPVQLDDR